MLCCKCGRSADEKHFHLGMCQSCYEYYRKGGTENPLPKPGTIEYDYRGYVVCHICGRAYKRLGSHIKESHGMSMAEYKEAFGLCNNARTTEKTYSEQMRKLAYKYDMHKRLKVLGENTRIKKGENNKRKGKKSRLQECLERSERYLKK